MKRPYGIAILSFLALWFQLDLTYAQQLGLKGGLNLSTIRANADTLDYKYKPGYHIGITVNIRASGNINVQLELVYSTQGAWTQQNRDLSLRYNYLNLPLVFQLYTRRDFFVELGPQVGFLLNAKTRDGQYEVDISDQVNAVDFAFLAGIGYQISNKLTFNTRFNFGISSLAKHRQRIELRSTNQVFQSSLAYSFR